MTEVYFEQMVKRLLFFCQSKERFPLSGNICYNKREVREWEKEYRPLFEQIVPEQFETRCHASRCLNCGKDKIAGKEEQYEHRLRRHCTSE